MKSFFTCIALIMISKLVSAQNIDTILLFFDHDKSTILNPHTIDKNLMMLKSAGRVDIVGYTDHLGGDGYNLRLSQRRAHSVQSQLQLRIKDLKLERCVGLGELPSLSHEPEPLHRRVEIYVFSDFSAVGSTSASQTELEENEEIKPLEIDTSADKNIVLSGINFIGGQHYPLPESKPAINKLLKTMKIYPNLKIEIQGYICCDYNQFDGFDFHTQTMNLSENRAKYLYDYLVESGIDPTRLSYKGYGSTKPLVFPEQTEEDRLKNRRVEIQVLN